MASKPYREFEAVPTLAESDPKDHVAKINAHAQNVREQLVTVATVRLLREKMKHCYRVEGVNHQENCKTYVQAYYDAITAAKAAGGAI